MSFAHQNKLDSNLIKFVPFFFWKSYSSYLFHLCSKKSYLCLFHHMMRASKLCAIHSTSRAELKFFSFNLPSLFSGMITTNILCSIVFFPSLKKVPLIVAILISLNLLVILSFICYSVSSIEPLFCEQDSRHVICYKGF